MSINTGGPAFPAFEVRTHDTGDLVQNASQGMTLRDYFAAKAMQSLLVCDVETIYPEWIARNEKGQFSISLTAYAMADAMLEVRGE